MFYCTGSSCVLPSTGMKTLSLSTISQSSFIRFAAVGVLSTALDFLVLNVFLHFGASVYVAGALGFFAGFSNGYLLNSRYVFQQASRERYIKYFIVSLGGLLLTELFLDIFHVRIGWSENVAKAIAVVIVFFWNYGLSKWWVFNA